MENFMKNLMSSPIAWSVLSVCTIASLLFGIFTWIKSKNKKRMTVDRSSYNIVKKGKATINRLSLLFDGKEVDDLTITRFAIWNSGNEEIRWEDIPTESPLRILSEGNAEILDAELIVETEASNKIAIQSITSNSIEIEFEYIDKKEGAVFQIIHTGDEAELEVDCKVKGGKIMRLSKDISNKENAFWDVSNRIINGKYFVFFWILLILIITAFMAFVILSIFGVVPLNHTPSEMSLSDKIITSITMLLMQGAVVFFSIKLIKKYFKPNVPSEIRDYI